MSETLNVGRNFVKILTYFFAIFILLRVIEGCGTNSKKPDESGNSSPKDLALMYLSHNHLDEAVAAFQQAIKMSPSDTSSYIGLTRLYILQKNYNDAETTAQSGLKISPDNEDLMVLLAEVYIMKNNNPDAIAELKKVIVKNPRNVNAYYKIAQLDTSVSNESERKFNLLKVQNLVPANIVPRIELAALYAGENKTDSTRFYLQSVKKIAPDFTTAAEKFYDDAISSLDANQLAKALLFIQQFHDLMKITPAYSAGLDEIEIPQMHAGFFDFDTNIPVSSLDTSLSSAANPALISTAPLKFTDISDMPGASIPNGLRASGTTMAVADYDGEGNMYLYSSYVTPGASNSKSFLSIIKMGTFQECSVDGDIDHKGQDLDATFADYDNDGFQDLFISTTKGILIYKNKGDGTFSKVTDDIGIHNADNVNKILFADFDQDGDLDMFCARKGGNRFFRNNGDGTFTENAAAMGLSGNGQNIIDMDYGDWDNDGDLDIVGLKAGGGVVLYNNNRHSNFIDISDSLGLQNPKYTGTTIAFGDYNNDGRLDIIICGASGGKCFLLRNDINKFDLDEKASEQLSNALKGIQAYDVQFVDYDNDGYEDIVVAGVNADNSKRGVRLFHNDGVKGFSDASSLLPEKVMQAYQTATADFNFDGDRDIFFSGPNGVQLARNDGGNYNNYVQVQLTGLAFGSSKNNRLGIGAQVELKAGDLYQIKTVKGPLTEFGVGTRTKLDALRIIWPNGVAQTVVDPTRKQRALEEAELKGSCPFLFTWDGEKYKFLKDMLWRSALGMPVAIHGKDTTYAYSNPSKEYLLIPGDELQPRNGLYTLKITEELWEAVYFDKAALIALDHPDSVSVYANEKFVAPPYPGKKVYMVSHPFLPASATDGNGNNVLPKISKYDFQYVSDFSMGKFQGLVKEHDLILDLGQKAHSDKLLLYLRGWIFPPDASINTELTQTNKYKLEPPSLQVINKEGKWQTVIPDIGYPMGRDKMVIVNLSGKFLTPNDRRVRIRTNMQIYWDHIFFTTGQVKAPLEMHDLKMVSAQLNYRGYSSSYHKGGPYGPQWFNYYNVTKGQKWRDLTGYYTRYGDVTPLLQKADDEYIIADGGDEVTINFDATHLPALPKGWKRDFLIYSEGWVKDGDLNTAYGQTVAPLPFHSMPSYPYGYNITYPNDKAHREYRRIYNTRKVTDADFRNAVRLGTFANPAN